MTDDELYDQRRTTAHDLTDGQIKAHLGHMSRRKTKATRSGDFPTWANLDTAIRAYRDELDYRRNPPTIDDDDEA